MSAFRWTGEDLAAFAERRKKWEESGTVRTHNFPKTRTDIQLDVEFEKNRNRALAVKAKYIPEKKVLAACLDILYRHPKVAFCWRQNTGLAFGMNSAVRFSFRGCSDILGCLVDGRFLAVEAKATGKRPSPEQQAFLDAVNKAGGLGMWIDDPTELLIRLA